MTIAYQEAIEVVFDHAFAIYVAEWSWSCILFDSNMR